MAARPSVATALAALDDSHFPILRIVWDGIVDKLSQICKVNVSYDTDFPTFIDIQRRKLAAGEFDPFYWELHNQMRFFIEHNSDIKIRRSLINHCFDEIFTFSPTGIYVDNLLVYFNIWVKTLDSDTQSMFDLSDLMKKFVTQFGWVYMPGGIPPVILT